MIYKMLLLTNYFIRRYGLDKQQFIDTNKQFTSSLVIGENISINNDDSGSRLSHRL